MARTSAPAEIATLAELLHETAEHHDPYEKAAPPHDWWDWYAAYLDARQHGSTPEEASQAAGAYMEAARGVVVR
jgi:hypothetical protein